MVVPLLLLFCVCRRYRRLVGVVVALAAAAATATTTWTTREVRFGSWCEKGVIYRERERP